LEAVEIGRASFFYARMMTRSSHEARKNLPPARADLQRAHSGSGIDTLTSSGLSLPARLYPLGFTRSALHARLYPLGFTRSALHARLYTLGFDALRLAANG
jgi:hypothetical protein